MANFFLLGVAHSLSGEYVAASSPRFYALNIIIPAGPGLSFGLVLGRGSFTRPGKPSLSGVKICLFHGEFPRIKMPTLPLTPGFLLKS